MEGQGLPTECWHHFRFSENTVNDRPDNLGVTCGQHVEIRAVVDFLNRKCR